MTRANDNASIVAGTFAIPAGSLNNAIPADGSITTAKLANDAVTAAKLANDSVHTVNIADDAVTAAAIADDAVTAAAIADGAVQGVDTGTIAAFGVTSAPSGWLKCNGQVITTANYADLYAVIGSTFNQGGEVAGEFRVPDLRGLWVRGLDDGRGKDSGRTLGPTAQNDGIPRMRGRFSDNHGNSRMSVNSVSGFTNPFVGNGSSSWRTSIEAVSGNYARIELDSARVITATGDVQVENVALLYCIKT